VVYAISLLSVCQFVYLFVCLFVGLLAYQKITVQISPNFLCVLPVTVARSSDANSMLCTSGFVDDVIFPYNGGNRPESKMTRMFRLVRQVVAPVGRPATLFGRDRQVVVPGAKSAVFDCILLDNSMVSVVCRRRLSGSVMLPAGGPAAGHVGGRAADTLHNGPARLRPVKATPCFSCKSRLSCGRGVINHFLV